MAKRIADPSLDTRHWACLGVNGARGLPIIGQKVDDEVS